MQWNPLSTVTDAWIAIESLDAEQKDPRDALGQIEAYFVEPGTIRRYCASYTYTRWPHVPYRN